MCANTGFIVVLSSCFLGLVGRAVALFGVPRPWPPQPSNYKPQTTDPNPQTTNLNPQTINPKLNPQKKRHHKNTNTPPPPQKHHHKNAKTPLQKHHHTTKTPPHHHHHKNTATKNTTTKTPPHKQRHKKHHHKNTTTQTPPHKHHHKNTKTPPQKQRRKNTTTKPQPQKHHHKNKNTTTKTKTPPQKHHRKNQKHHHKNTTANKNTTTKTPPLPKTPPHHHHHHRNTPPQKHNHRSTTTKTARGFLQISAFSGRLPPNFKVEASKMIVSCEASFKFQRRSFQNDRFVRGFHQISKKKLPKWSFRARLPPNFKEEASKMIVSCEASTKFQKRSFQNDRFVRGFHQISKKKLPKWSFRARLPPNFKEEASKMIVSCEASTKFKGRSFQNDCFVRGFYQISKKKLPKWSFRARHRPNFKKASKMMVSREASSKFQKRSFQNDRFVRGFYQISRKKLPKWSFRARLPPNFKEEASKMIVSCEASTKFQKRSFQNDCFVRGFHQISKKKLPKWSFRARLPPNFKK